MPGQLQQLCLALLILQGCGKKLIEGADPESASAVAARGNLMDVAGVKELCSSYPAATVQLYGPPSNVLVYSVAGKRFAYFKTSQPELWRFSIRTTAERFLELTGVPGIKPARYMARYYWVTIVNLHAIPAGYLQELIDWSYAKALSSLPKRQQTLIKG
jgi:predicted DNA-binding protein (MmcQ/YjbR family)